MQANNLIQEYGFEKAFDVALATNEFDVAREIEAIEKRMFGNYRNTISPTSQFPICSNPLRIDIYNHCPYGCTYCFAGNTGKEVVVGASLSKTKRDLKKVFENGKLSGKEKLFSKMVAMGWPIHIGGMNDPMPPTEKHKRIFYNTLLELQKYEHPCSISTKSNLPLTDTSYIDLFADMRAYLVFQMSIISVNNYRFLEPLAVNPKLRIKTLAAICTKGVNSIVRLQPFMPQLIDEQQELFKIYADIGVKGVTVEGLKIKKMLPSNKLKLAIMRSFGIEIDKELTAQRYSKSIYPIKTKIKYHKELRDIAHSYGLQYYVADNNLRFMGDSPNCCGTDLIGAKVNDYNITHLAYTHPQDFGFHLIKDENNDYLQSPVSYADFKPRQNNIYATLQKLYNDPGWMYATYEETYTDSDGNKHWRVKPEYLYK